MKRLNYALITALFSNKDRGLYTDIYFPIIKYAIVKIFCTRKLDDCYASSADVHEKIKELFGIQIPSVVIAKTVQKLACMSSGGLQMEVYEHGKTFRIQNAHYDEEDNSYEEMERSFNCHLTEIESEYKAFVEREGTCGEEVSFLDFISSNTANVLGYFDNDKEDQIREKYTILPTHRHHRR